MFLFTTPPTRSSAPGTPVVDAIRQGAERTGVGFDYLLATAQRESALDPSARARTSSASGLFQFIEQTWLGLIKSDGGKIGLANYADAVSTRSDGTHIVSDPSLKQAILSLRQDPEVASVMAGALTQKNREALSSALGREPSSADLYMAHFLGARGAADLIQAALRDPNRPVASDFPEAAAANRSIFYGREGRARGAGEVYALLAQSHSSQAASPAAANGDRPAAFVPQDGPAFHGLFQTGGRRGPVSDAVAKLWRHGRSDLPPEPALSYFPNSQGGSVVAREPVVETPEPTGSAPLPPPRPDRPAAVGPAAQPLDLSRFMALRKP
jgi:hypothetical protein